MRICVDITELYRVNYVSGIQRVVIEVTTRWIRDGRNLLLLVYNPRKDCFFEVDNEKYLAFYTRKSKKKNYLKRQCRMKVEDFGEGDVFFDMDSVWMNPYKRSCLLPQLKNTGCKIAAHIYDIIPVTEPQYCHEFTTISFMEYIGAQLQHADLLISNAQATVDAMGKLTEGTAVQSLNAAVVKLGSDIKSGGQTQNVREHVRNLPQKGKYVLMVGTIEPRKNHAYILKAFEDRLFETGINLVMAGRIGWNVESLVSYIREHEMLDKSLFFYNDLSDAEISFLYENCLVVAFPSYNEGFGLPIIEAFDRGAPVLAADIPVLREVGGEYCRYFSLTDTGAFARLVENYMNNPDEYEADKEKIKNYVRTTWDECAENMYIALKDKI